MPETIKSPLGPCYIEGEGGPVRFWYLKFTPSTGQAVLGFEEILMGDKSRRKTGEQWYRLEKAREVPDWALELAGERIENLRANGPASYDERIEE